MVALEPKKRVALDVLLAALADVFDKEGRPGGSAAASALRTAHGHSYREVQAKAEPGPLLETACKQAGALPIAASILACRSFLSWCNWAGAGLAEDLSSRLYTAELVGPDGHLAHDDVRVGLLISDVSTNYPISRHSGEETYIVISGMAEWSVDNAPYKRHHPGTLIHHPAWAPHGRRTLEEPFLGAWRWSGDLDLSSFSIDAV